MTPEEVTTALTAALAAFPAIEGRPLDDHCVEIKNIISSILRQVDNYNEVDCVQEEYYVKFGHYFVAPSKLGLCHK